MAHKLVQKTFKVELEITVSMDEVTGEDTHAISHLQQLQKSLIEDESALQEILLASGLEKLHEYIDYLTTQDCLESLKTIVERLSPEDQRYFQKYKSDFFDITRPLRRGSISVNLINSEINEQEEKQAEESGGWRLIWKDLAPASQLSQVLANLPLSTASAQKMRSSESRHFLISRHLTQQPNGIHFEADCSCNTHLEGVGSDEDQAVSALWDQFREHWARYEDHGKELPTLH